MSKSITREKYRKALREVLLNPISEEDTKDIPAEHLENLRMQLFMSGAILFDKLEKKLFGEGEK